MDFDFSQLSVYLPILLIFFDYYCKTLDQPVLFFIAFQALAFIVEAVVAEWVHFWGYLRSAIHYCLPLNYAF